jgi:arylsulfatase A-like enzyme
MRSHRPSGKIGFVPLVRGRVEVAMSGVQFIYRRMAAGSLCLGFYGLWVACLRLPTSMPAGTRMASWAWALGLFAGAGMILTAAVAMLAILGARPLRPAWRPGAAATIETALLVPFLVWLVLNEITYSVTSEVIGYGTLMMIWANPAATFEGAWEMGMRYLLGAGMAVLTIAVVGWWLSYRSFRTVWPPGGRASCPPLSCPSSGGRASCCPPSGAAPASCRYSGARASRTPSSLSPAGGGLEDQEPCPSTGLLSRRRRPSAHRLAGSMTGGLVILAGLLTWQVHTRPSEALTTVCRSAPPLRALNVTRALLGLGLDGPLDLRPGAPIISELEYQARMGAPREPAPNVVFIVLESVPAKALHCYGYPRTDISPHIDALAAGGVLFEHCVNTASFSSYGLVSLLTSLYMLRAEHNDHFKDTSFPHYSLPRALKLAGYQLALFSSGNEAFDNINQFTPPADFDEYFSLDTADVPKPDCMRLDDQYAVERFEAWMAARKDRRPFYCGFYLQSTHFNYEVPEPWASHYLPVPPLYSNGSGIIHIPPDILPLLRNQYDNALRFSDYWVGRIRSALEKAGVFDNTLVVIVGDHGEAFMEHGLARHGVALWEEMIHIPFILYAGPAVRATLDRPLPSRVAGTVSGVDVAPTVAGLVGIRPHPSWQGTDVLAPGYTGQDRPVFSVLQLTRWQEAVVLNGFKYIYDLTEVRPQLFDLGNDPGETVDLVHQRPELANVMKDILGAWHTRQLHYYAPANRPFTDYLGRFEPDPVLLERFHAAIRQVDFRATTDPLTPPSASVSPSLGPCTSILNPEP